MIYFIYFLIVVTFIDTFSQLPIISPYAQELGASALLIGLIIGIYSFTNIIGNIISGYYIDQKGIKKIVSLGLMVTGIILITYSFAETPTQLFVVRFFHGLSGGLLVPAAFTYLSNKDPGEKKGKIMAFSGACVGIASIIGPAYGGIMKETLGINFVFSSIGILMIIMSIISYFILPEVQRSHEKKNTKTSGITIELIKRPLLIYGYVGAFSLMFSQGILAYMLPLKVEILGFDSSLSGVLMSTFAIVSTAIFILPTNRLYDKVPYSITMIIGLFILSISLFALEFIVARSLLYIIMGLYGVGFALIFPSMSALVAKNSNVNERGKAYGLFYGFFSFGVIAGALMTGLFTDVFSPFLIGAIVLFINSSLLLIFKDLKVVQDTNYLSVKRASQK
ncbi:MFS transporter [Ornithinibacillus halophilus]|uniref:Predicted arabinose efflux permease, MFS family n=1 Tax=Ornithinibacillus halophilus TaxID=930117 RepID=A0A1M5I541_9BACI|nr:MFS transporter [Ornithinibacillus halophilus]SHG23444.1 Predicted arabinose efflux permease, MFS family [Ornithinibacillus halophilus]